MKRKARLVKIKSDHQTLNRNRPLVRGWRLRKFETHGLKAWSKLAPPLPRSCGVSVEYIPRRPGLKLPVAAVRALVAMVDVPLVLVVPPGTPRRGGVMGKTFPCAGVFHWDQKGLPEVLDQWWAQNGHVIAVIPECLEAPRWLQDMIAERFKLEAILAQIERDRWSFSLTKKSAPLKISRGAKAQGARGAMRLGEERCA